MAATTTSWLTAVAKSSCNVVRSLLVFLLHIYLCLVLTLWISCLCSKTGGCSKNGSPRPRLLQDKSFAS
jgi:hypothetical protein